MSTRPQTPARNLKWTDRASKTSSTISERTIYSPNMEPPPSDIESLVNQLEIHEASVDVKIGQSKEEYRQSLVSLESSVCQVEQTFKEIDLIKELEKKVRTFHKTEGQLSLHVKGFGKLLIYKDIKVIESSDHKTRKAIYRRAHLFEKELVLFKHGDNAVYEKAYPITDLILNNNINQRSDEQSTHTEPSLSFIRQVTDGNRNLSSIRYISIYFKKKEDADVFAKAFIMLQDSLTSYRAVADNEEVKHYEKTEQLENLYHGILTGAEASKILSGTPNGTFFVRFGTTQMRFAIALSFKSQVYHLLIEETSTGNVYLDEEFQFKSIKDLVNYYRNKTLEECFAHLPLALDMAYKECEFHRVLYLYAPRKKHYLDIRPGDIIQLLDSSMAETGWLFGKMVQNGKNETGLYPMTYVVKNN